jgi:hypothetical protein
MKIIQASFFWKNDKPGGIGLTFGAPDFSPEEIQDMFAGQVLKTYLRESDKALGTNLVEEYLGQLQAIGERKERGEVIPVELGILAALNIIWLVDRGFIPRDEFNGYQIIRSMT